MPADSTLDINHTDHTLSEDALLKKQMAEFSQLLKQQDQWRLSFPTKTEKAYQHFLKKEFIETNKFTVCFGVLFYASFFVVDYLFYEDINPEVLIIRVIISIIAGLLLSAIFFKQSVKHVLNTTLFCAIVMGLQVVFSAMFYFQQPYNLIYAIGVLPIIVFGILIFRFSFRHTFILVASLLGGYLLHVVASYPYKTDASSLQDLLNVASPIMVIFMAAICIMGLYMSYAVDKLNRSNWIKNHIMRIESLQLNKLTNQLEMLSTTDGLTGLYNRRYFDTQLQKHWHEHTQLGQPLSVIMLDLDWFKPYNDFYGHQQGDICLQDIGKSFSETCNNIPSVVARYGGEEFIIIVPNMHAKDAHDLAQKLCQNVFAKRIKHVASPLGNCSVSVGVHTTYPAKATNDNAIGKFLQEVDMALYQSKALGKNRVSVYQN